MPQHTKYNLAHAQQARAACTLQVILLKRTKSLHQTAGTVDMPSPSTCSMETGAHTYGRTVDRRTAPLNGGRSQSTNTAPRTHDRGEHS